MAIVGDIFPSVLSQSQKQRKLSNLLHRMKVKDRLIDCDGPTKKAVWFLLP